MSLAIEKLRAVGKGAEPKKVGDMEREFEFELARVFGDRIRRIFKLEEAPLPPSIAERLARLERAEKVRLCPCHGEAGETSHG